MVASPAATGRSAVERWRHSPVVFLSTINVVNWVAFAGWSALFNNFGAEVGQLDWAGIGLVQSVREVPGLLAFTAIAWLLIMREQTLAYAAMAALTLGVALTGYLPTLWGILLTTTVMSFGFHYLETMNQSLSLQLLPKERAAAEMGIVAAAGAAAQFAAYGFVVVAGWAGLVDYERLFLILGAFGLLIAAMAVLIFPRFDGHHVQRRGIVLKRRYGLYYALTFMSGARRQIFTAFAAYLLVKTFSYRLQDVAMLMLVTAAANTLLAGRLGSLIGRIGERRAVAIENLGLIAIFAGYGVTVLGIFGPAGWWVAGVLFLLDGVFTTFVIAQRTYFQKIGDAEDMAPTAAVAFAINHIMAVAIPVAFGVLAMRQADPAIIFWLGCGIAAISLALAQLIPRNPVPGREIVGLGRLARAQP